MQKTPRITQDMIALYDEYTHLTLDRRHFMRQLKILAGSSAAAAAVLPLIEANQARAALLPADDLRIVAERVTYTGETGPLAGYLVKPADATDPLPGVIVIHENRGLNLHIEDVTRRLALEGFVALAPDFLSPVGGTPPDEDQAREMIRALDGGATLANARAAITYLQAREDVTGGIGAMGFCWGGGLVNQLAVADPDLTAGVAYYGRVPDPAQVSQIAARMMLHYAGLDERINAGIDAYRAALDAADIDYTMHMYDDVNHAFNNDTSAARYDKEAAELAWQRTIAFFKETL